MYRLLKLPWQDLSEAWREHELFYRGNTGLEGRGDNADSGRRRQTASNLEKIAFRVKDIPSENCLQFLNADITPSRAA